MGFTAGVADQDVDSAERPQDGVAQGEHIILDRDVGDVGHRVAPDFGTHGLQRRGGAAADDDRSAMRRQPHRHGTADAAATAGDDSDQAGQVEGGQWFDPRLTRCLANDQR